MGPCSIFNFTVNSVWKKAICLFTYIASGNSEMSGKGIRRAEALLARAKGGKSANRGAGGQPRREQEVLSTYRSEPGIESKWDSASWCWDCEIP